MKRSLLIFALIIVWNSLSGQKSIDDLFRKYSGKDGFVTLTISGNLLKLSSCIDEEDGNSALPENITEIRILAQEDNKFSDVDFYDKVIGGLDLDDYEEFMQVKEAHQDTRMLVRSDGKALREFLLISGGKDNALIQIKGKMSLNDANKFSKELKKNGNLKIDMDSK
jgi:hypothetical protein